MLFAASREHASVEVVTASKLANKSLFWNILPVSPFVARFCPDRPRIPLRKSFVTRILQNSAKKMWVFPQDRTHSQRGKVTVAPARFPEAGSRRPRAGPTTEV